MELNPGLPPTVVQQGRIQDLNKGARGYSDPQPKVDKTFLRDVQLE